MDKLIITITCDSTMSYPRNPYNPKGLESIAEEYVRSVNRGASIFQTETVEPTPCISLWAKENWIWTQSSNP